MIVKVAAAARPPAATTPDNGPATKVAITTNRNPRRITPPVATRSVDTNLIAPPVQSAPRGDGQVQTTSGRPPRTGRSRSTDRERQGGWPPRTELARSCP